MQQCVHWATAGGRLLVENVPQKRNLYKNTFIHKIRWDETTSPICAHLDPEKNQDNVENPD